MISPSSRRVMSSRRPRLAHDAGRDGAAEAQDLLPEGEADSLLALVADVGRVAVEEGRRAGPVAPLERREDAHEKVGDCHPGHDPDRAPAQLLVEVHRVHTAEDPHPVATGEPPHRGDLRRRRRLLEFHVATGGKLGRDPDEQGGRHEDSGRDRFVLDDDWESDRPRHRPVVRENRPVAVQSGGWRHHDGGGAGGLRRPRQLDR